MLPIGSLHQGRRVAAWRRPIDHCLTGDVGQEGIRRWALTAFQAHLSP